MIIKIDEYHVNTDNIAFTRVKNDGDKTTLIIQFPGSEDNALVLRGEQANRFLSVLDSAMETVPGTEFVRQVVREG